MTANLLLSPGWWCAWALWAVLVAGTAGGAPRDGEESAARLYVNDKEAPEDLRDLRKIQEALRVAYPKVRAAAVGIDIGEGSGSGVIVSPEGLILTAAHVSGGVDKELTVVLEDGTRVQAKSLGLGSETDCAMMQITEEGAYPYVEMDRDDTARLGDWVFSLGHSGGFDKDRGVAVRLGRLVRVTQTTIQSDCKLIGGDSGGPLFDMSGRLIGIHSRVGGSKEENMHVPLREFFSHWDAMLAGEFLGNGPFAKRPQKAKLGTAIEAREEGGLEIVGIEEDSAASVAGLQVGDVILKVDGEPVEEVAALQEAVGAMADGGALELLILRDDEEIEIKVELGSG